MYPGDISPFSGAFQAIQRRLEEIEVTFRELEEKGIKLERALRGEGGRAHVLTYQCPRTCTTRTHCLSVP